jgi:hypothetical protein
MGTHLQKTLQLTGIQLAKSQTISPELAVKIAYEVEGSSVDVLNIASAPESCMKLLSQDQLMILLPSEIESIALNYCGAVMGDRLRETVVECYDFLRMSYNGLAFPEIKRAFVLAAAGTIDVDLKAYNGNFTVRILGDTLRAYMVYRNKIQNQLKAREREQNDLEIDNRIREYYASEEGIKQVEDYYENQLKKYFDFETLTVNDVTSRMYLYLEKKGVIALTPNEKREYYNKAKDIYTAELMVELGTANAVKKNSIKETLAIITNNNDTKSVKISGAINARCVVLAQRLAVIDYVANVKKTVICKE